MKDEYSGQGGSYLLDPETGIRTLIKRTLPAEPKENDGTSSSQTPNPDRGGGDLWDGPDSDGDGCSLGEGSEYCPPAE